MRHFPNWLRRELPSQSTHPTEDTVRAFALNTVCESCKCPNRVECWSRRTATFMILGEICTRACGFCSIETGRPLPLEADEPVRVAMAAERLHLNHVVVTSVARDELPDEGAGQFHQTIVEIRKRMPHATVEVLVPDFHGREELISHVCDAHPHVYNHNVETVERLTPRVRRQAKYRRSLEVLQFVKRYDASIVTKSGIMVGLGETWDEIIRTMEDLRAVSCDMLTIGQYLKPRSGKLEVEAYVHPEVFRRLEDEGRLMGFREVFSGPYVRSSYHAGESYHKTKATTEMASHG